MNTQSWEIGQMNTTSADSSALTHKKWRYFLRQNSMKKFSFLLSCANWQRLMNMKVGIIPLPMYSGIFICLSALLILEKISGDISIMIALLAVCGFTCAAIGERIPVLRQIGGPVIVSIFLPACLIRL